ncbi:hypothetical protein C6P45_001586 [Maudiozyma exigua]|uniref:Uncharacterized protein n=1 Tax=Maudiozyma exigua TaxID=34358 RepID=A0A9P6W238_MAUEX|nr:hypothetical protein C6P45_001586 [Kazachstania exigua]
MNRSQEGFTDLEEAPVPKDNFEDTVKSTYQNNRYVGAPTNNYRRASTSRESSVVEQPSRMSRNPSMNMQDAIHVRRLSTEIKSDDLVDDILDDDSKEESKNNKTEDSDNCKTHAQEPITFNEKYNDNSATEPQNTEHPLKRRGSSFQYEDYKKEMYDRVGF